MNFNENRAIYLQIADWMYEKILAKDWKPGDRIPAVRELAILLEVNPNTVMRTYQQLESMNVISLKRGTGYYLTDNAHAIVFDAMKKDFFENSLPTFFKNLSILHVSQDELVNLYNQYLSSNK